MKNLILELGQKVKSKEMTWQEASELYNNKSGENTTGEILRKRYSRIINSNNIPNSKEYELHNQDGSIEINKKIWFDKDEEKTPDSILIKFGYNPNEWEIINWSFGSWEVAIKDEENRLCTTIRCKIKPKFKKELTIEEYVEIAKKVFGEEIKPQKIKSSKKYNLDKNKLLEIPALELHLGKIAWDGETGQNYNSDIAQKRFYTILEKIIEQQETELCDTCLLCIGNDFFNSDTINETTTRGTQQTNDLRWKQLFNLGLELHIKLIETLKTKFNNIDIRYISGNHDTMASFYLYIALQCYYKNDNKVHFTDNYKLVQCYKWGKSSIFLSHGYGNLKRLIKSIPAEFFEEWGKSLYRELHLAHLHKEVVVDDDSGMITRRVGSPTGTDEYHYSERFIGATQKCQTFIWDKEKGLQSINYINFENFSKGGKKL